MMRKAFKYVDILFALNLLISAYSFPFLDDKTYHKKLILTSEQELKVNIESALGKLTIGEAADTNSIEIEVIRDSKLSDPMDHLEYVIINGIGYLRISNHSGESQRKLVILRSIESDIWKIYFTNKVPISFDIELGAGKGNFDFTGLRVKDLNISTGASSVVMNFDEMNKATIESINIESGVSKFKAYNLLNANFNTLNFSGGVGSYELNFGGELRKEVDISIEIGLGSLSLYIPTSIGTRVFYKKGWFSSIDLGKGFYEESENEFVTDNYYNSKGKLNINFETGMGSIKVKRVK